eukprot:Skav229679  [mRNA]  locus=scaffold4264:129743:131701:- [translate_table: standard]
MRAFAAGQQAGSVTAAENLERVNFLTQLTGRSLGLNWSWSLKLLEAVRPKEQRVNDVMEGIQEEMLAAMLGSKRARQATFEMLLQLAVMYVQLVSACCKLRCPGSWTRPPWQGRRGRECRAAVPHQDSCHVAL